MINPLDILGDNGFSPGEVEGDVILTDKGNVLLRRRVSPIVENTALSMVGFKEDNTAWSLIKAGYFSFYLTLQVTTGQYVLLDLAEVCGQMDDDQPHRFALGRLGLPNGNCYRALPVGLGVLASTVKLLPAGPATQTEWLPAIEYEGLTILPINLAGPGDIYEWRSSEGKKFIGGIFSREGYMVELGRARWMSLRDAEASRLRILRRES